MPSQPTSWKSILILSFPLRLSLPSGLVPSTFPTKNLYTTLLYPIRATCLAHFILLDLNTRTIFSEQYRSLSFSLCNFLHFPCHLVPLRPKYSHQHPIPKHFFSPSMWATKFHTHTKHISVPKPIVISVVDSRRLRVSASFRRELMMFLL